MNINKKTQILYAGGGLLAASELSDEWQETEDKLQTIGPYNAEALVRYYMYFVSRIR